MMPMSYMKLLRVMIIVRAIYQKRKIVTFHLQHKAVVLKYHSIQNVNLK